MPCFSPGPEKGTPQHAEWLTKVQTKLDAFTHVVDYYYCKAGLEMPELTEDELRNPRGATPVHPQVLKQILLHLDCDSVDVFQLNDIQNRLWEIRTPQARGYLRIAGHCFRELRAGFHDRPTSGATWAACGNPRLMLDHVRGQVSDRKLRLFAVACCRRVPHLLSDLQSQTAVEVAERYADGAATEQEFEACTGQMGVREIRGYYGPVAAWVVAPSADDAAQQTAWNAFDDRNGSDEMQHQANLIRCICGDPFRPVAFLDSYRFAQAEALAREMYDSRNFAAMPRLADALREAGCTDEQILNHCRPGGQHVCGCWVVDLVLGKV